MKVLFTVSLEILQKLKAYHLQELDTITGSGKDARVTKQMIFFHTLNNRRESSESPSTTNIVPSYSANSRSKSTQNVDTNFCKRW